MAKRYELTSAQWARIENLLPGKVSDPGRTGGGLSTKIHIAVDGGRRPIRFILTPGQVNDSTQALALLDGERPRYFLADKGYDCSL